MLNAAEGKGRCGRAAEYLLRYADTAWRARSAGHGRGSERLPDRKRKSEYIEGYLTEGDFNGDGSIKIFPTAKATEVLYLNDTDWQAFPQATGTTYDDLATVEGLTAAAEKYYNWTDLQTEAPDDGRALFAEMRWQTICSSVQRSLAARF